jgi:hypothetical protein
MFDVETTMDPSRYLSYSMTSTKTLQAILDNLKGRKQTPEIIEEINDIDLMIKKRVIRSLIAGEPASENQKKEQN